MVLIRSRVTECVCSKTLMFPSLVQSTYLTASTSRSPLRVRCHPCHQNGLVIINRHFLLKGFNRIVHQRHLRKPKLCTKISELRFGKEVFAIVLPAGGICFAGWYPRTDYLLPFNDWAKYRHCFLFSGCFTANVFFHIARSFYFRYLKSWLAFIDLSEAAISFDDLFHILFVYALYRCVHVSRWKRDQCTGGTSLANAKASVSVPVTLWYLRAETGFFFLAVSIISFSKLFCTAGPYARTGPLPQAMSPLVILFIMGLCVSWHTSVTIATWGLILLRIMVAPFNPTSSCTEFTIYRAQRVNESAVP